MKACVCNVRRQDGTLSTSFRDILVLEGLCRRQTVVLIEPINEINIQYTKQGIKLKRRLTTYVG